MVVTLLLLTCGTNACFHVAKTLKEKFPEKFRIIGCDINLQWMIPTSPYLDVYYQCPYTSNENYYPLILDICKKERVDYLLPSFDADQGLFYAENKDLEELGVKSFGISEKIKDIYGSKVKTNQFLESIGLPTPKMYDISTIQATKEYFVKPQNGVGSIGAKVSSGIDLLKFYDKNLIIQDICKEPEVTLECFNYQGEIYSVARLRLGRKSGVCTKTKIYQDKKLTEFAKKFSQSVQLPHIFNIQFMQNPNGEYVITDVNLRTAGGMSLSYTAGWDEVSALAKIMLGEDDVTSTVDIHIKEQYIIRAYTDIVTKQIGKKVGFDLDGTLLDSRKRHEILMQDILQSRGISIDASDLIKFKSGGANNIAWLQSKGIPTEEISSVNQEWIEKIESDNYLNLDKLYPDTIDKLKRLSKNNSLYLVTARCNEEGVIKQLQDLGIKQYFEDICVVPSGKNSSKLKSDYLIDNGIEIFVGDTEVDMEAAKNAGCNFYACYDGFRSKSFWSNYDVLQFNEKNIQQ